MVKYIFDFDDVLFFNADKFKKHMYKCFEEAGVSNEIVKKYYDKERDKGFVLENLVASVVEGEKISSISSDELAEKIMGECKNFVNNELINIIKGLGVENCFMVTHGVTEHQLDKINRTGIKSLFCDISIVQGSKKESVERICEKFKNNEVVFVDDKEERFADLNFEKYSNLRTVLYSGPDSIKEIFEQVDAGKV